MTRIERPSDLISRPGLDIGLDRDSPVSLYDAPFIFTGLLRRVTVTMDDDQMPDHDGEARPQQARQ